MGSELVDALTGEVLWGMSSLDWYVSAWTTGAGLQRLQVTADERAGQVGRIRATRLLRAPAFAPILRGVEPYRDLLLGLRQVVAHPDAVAEFPYDWRLAVSHNARQLARVAERHLDQWRRHPHGWRDARLILIAHSMGGLISHYYTGQLGGADLVCATVTLGTPFRGAVRAIQVLSQGQSGSVPLPRAHLRGLAVTLPGLYDLLPSYRCVDDGRSSRHCIPADIGSLGGNQELAEQSSNMHRRLGLRPTHRTVSVVGVGQPTMQSVTFAHGVASGHFHVCEQNAQGHIVRLDRRGDGTVYRDAASLVDVVPAYLPQTHSALARTTEALANVKAAVTHRRLGPPLGSVHPSEAVGVDVPDLVAVNEPFRIVVDGTDPAAVSCRLVELSTGDVVQYPQARARENTVVASASVSAPGVYRLEVDLDGGSAVTQLLMAVPADALMAGDA
jgi:pimeloyl-ACP methyl ester carboxylesterase